MTHTGKHVTDLIRPSADVLLRVRKRNYFAIINTQHKTYTTCTGTDDLLNHVIGAV